MRNGQYGSGIAFSQGVEKGSLAEVDNTSTTLLYSTLLPSVATRWWFSEDASLRQDQVLPSILAFLQFSPHIQPISLIPMHMQCSSLLASTLDEYSRLLCYHFPPFFFFPIDATRCRSPGARCHRRCLLLRGDRQRLGVVRRLPGRRPCLFDRCCFCASLLKATCLTHVCTQILLLPLTLVFSSLCIQALEAPGL